MKRLLALMLSCLLLLPMLPALAEQAGEKQPLVVRVYLFDPCGGCASADAGCRECAVVTKVFDRLVKAFRPLVDSGELQFLVRNLMYEQIRKERNTYLKGFGVDSSAEPLSPQYIVGEPGWGLLLLGESREAELPEAIDTVRARMPADAAWRRTPREGQDFVVPRSDPLDDIQPNDSLVIYLFKDYCPYCKDLEPLFASLPDSITLPDGSQSRLRFVSLEKQIPRQMAVVQRYYDRLLVHPDRQYVPMVIVGGKALFLQEEIEAGLMDSLKAGEGLKTDRAPLMQLKPDAH